MSRRGGRSGGRGRRGRDDEANDDNDRAGITAFNMEDEEDEGHFDDAGNFVWNKEEKHVQEEAWLDNVSEEQIGAAMAAKNQREYRDELAVETMTEETANRILSTLLLPRESVLKALQRLGSKRPKHRGTKRKQPESDAPAAQTPEERAQFDQVTEAADFLMRQGEVDVYSQLREEFVPEEELLAQRRDATTDRVTFAAEDGEREGKSEERPPPAVEALAKPETLWEYRGADGEIHGPFPSASFIAWQSQGYFVGDSAVDIRQVAPKADSSNSGASEKTAPEPAAPISAEQELLNDFEDSDDDDNGNASSNAAAAAESDAQTWLRSDQVDFASY